MRKYLASAATAAALLGLAASSQAEGNLAAGPPTDLVVTITTTPNGPVVSPASFDMVTGKYYRLNFTFAGPDTDPDWRLEVNDLLANSHVRVMTIGGIELHIQGMPFRALEFDGAGTVQFSFVVIRPGNYPFIVGDNPGAMGLPVGTPGQADPSRRAIGMFQVK